jgi:chemotaxis methyl-accepting protein methylase
MRCQNSRHFRNKKREFMKDRIDELATNNKNKNIRHLCGGINEVKKG